MRYTIILNNIFNLTVAVLLGLLTWSAWTGGGQPYSTSITVYGISFKYILVLWITFWLGKWRLEKQYHGNVKTPYALHILAPGIWRYILLLLPVVAIALYLYTLPTLSRYVGMKVALYENKNNTTNKMFETTTINPGEWLKNVNMDSLPGNEIKVMVKAYLWVTRLGEYSFYINAMGIGGVFLDDVKLLHGASDLPNHLVSKTTVFTPGIHKLELELKLINPRKDLEIAWKYQDWIKPEPLPNQLAFWKIPPPGDMEIKLAGIRLFNVIKTSLITIALYFSMTIFLRLNSLNKVYLSCSFIGWITYIIQVPVVDWMFSHGLTVLIIILDQTIFSEISMATGVFFLTVFLAGKKFRWSLGIDSDSMFQTIIMGLSVLGFICSMYVYNKVYEGFPIVNGDEHAYQFQAELLAQGKLYEKSHPLPEFFQYEMILYDNNKMFGVYPPGQPLLMVPGVLVGRIEIVPAILFGLTIYVVGCFTALIYTRWLGILASVMLLLSPQCLFVFSTRLSHSGSTFFLILFLYMIFLSDKKCNLFYLVWAGTCLSISFLCRPATTVAYSVIPMVLFFIPRLKRFYIFSKAILPFMAGFIPLFMVFFSYNYFLTGDPLTMPYRLYNPHSTLGFGDEKGISQKGSKVLGEGKLTKYTPAMACRFTLDNILSLNEYMFGWRFSLFLPMALLFIKRKTWIEWSFAGSAAGLVFLYSLFWNKGINFAGPIYYTDMIPIMVILACGFLDKVSKSWNTTTTRISILTSMMALFFYSTTSFIPLVVTDLENFILKHYFYFRKINDTVSGKILVFTPYLTEIVDKYTHEPGMYPPDILYVTHVSREMDKKITRFYPGRRSFYIEMFQDYIPYQDPEPLDKTCFPGKDYGDERSDVKVLGSSHGEILFLDKDEKTGFMWQRRKPGDYVISVRARSVEATGSTSILLELVDSNKRILLEKSFLLDKSYGEYSVNLSLYKTTILGVRIKSRGDGSLYLDEICILLKGK